MTTPEKTPFSSSSGDDGRTTLSGRDRLDKSDPKICAAGSLDELNAALGLLRAACNDVSRSHEIENIQNDLLKLGSELATDKPQLSTGAVDRLSEMTRSLNNTLPPLNHFVKPGANEVSARAHWARTVCRRAERDWVRTRGTAAEGLPDMAAAYLNRLSSWLFALARKLERQDSGFGKQKNSTPGNKSAVWNGVRPSGRNEG